MEFASPSSTYRPAPFWSWNDTLTEEELRRQIGQLQGAGYGGFFMHSRVGLETEYLSDAWGNAYVYQPAQRTILSTGGGGDTIRTTF